MQQQHPSTGFSTQPCSEREREGGGREGGREGGRKEGREEGREGEREREREREGGREGGRERELELANLKDSFPV